MIYSDRKQHQHQSSFLQQWRCLIQNQNNVKDRSLRPCWLHFLFPTYYIRYYYEKYTTDYGNTCDTPDDNTDGVTNGTRDNQDNIINYICYQTF